MKSVLKEEIPTTLKDALSWEISESIREKAIRANYLRGTESYLIVGLLLRVAKNKRDWETAGIAHSFWEWVEKELLISTTNGKKMLDVWDYISPYINDQYDLVMQIDFSKLAEIAPIIKNMEKKDALEWLHKAATNTVKDLRNNIIEHKGGTPPDICDHIRTEMWFKCLKCKAFFKKEG